MSPGPHFAMMTHADSQGAAAVEYEFMYRTQFNQDRLYTNHVNEDGHQSYVGMNSYRCGKHLPAQCVVTLVP